MVQHVVICGDVICVWYLAAVTTSEELTSSGYGEESIEIVDGEMSGPIVPPPTTIKGEKVSNNNYRPN